MSGHRHRGDYWDAELAKTYVGLNPGPVRKWIAFTISRASLKEMDEVGIDIQVLSHGAPSAQKLPADTAVAITRGVNDRLAAACAANAMALPPSPPFHRRPKAPPTNERCVTRLGFKGAMLHGLANGVFLMTSASGQSTNVRRNSTCRSISIPACPISA